MSLKPLGKVKDLIESVGMEISYAYDDLVFLNHSALLLQFTGEDNALLVHVNAAADTKKADEAISRLKSAAPAHGLTVRKGKRVGLLQGKDDTIQIEFYD